MKPLTLQKNMYSQWSPLPAELIPGYTIMLMTPGDLPVFLKIALEVCATQNPEHLVEILVIPDRVSPGFSEVFEEMANNYPFVPIRLVHLKPSELLLTRHPIHPHINNWLQFVRGVEQARTSHLLWHDVDLFLNDPEFLRHHYERCRQRGLSCLGVSPPWDTWYENNGYGHIVATWELMFSLGWARSFPPWAHRGHDDILDGKYHTFDATLLPQCRTSPEQIQRHEQEEGFIHFNYVIGTYRWFQQRQGPFEDEYFRLLLTRLLINAYDPSTWPYEVPSLADLFKGIGERSMPVTYHQTLTRDHYAEFRNKLQRLLESGLLDDRKVSCIRSGVQPFDDTFGKPEHRIV